MFIYFLVNKKRYGEYCNGNECDDAYHLTCSKNRICDCIKTRGKEYFVSAGICFKASDYNRYCLDDNNCSTLEQHTVCISSKCVCPKNKKWNGNQCGKLKKIYLKRKLELFINIFYVCLSTRSKQQAMFRLNFIVILAVVVVFVTSDFRDVGKIR